MAIKHGKIKNKKAYSSGKGFNISVIVMMTILFCQGTTKAQTLYSLTRIFLDIQKQNQFEDLAEVKERLFLESKYTKDKYSILFSGKIDLNYFYGGFPRFQGLFDLHEIYLSTSLKNASISFGRKIVSLGIVDNSPYDAISRPDFREGFFNLTDPNFLKTPGIILDSIMFIGNSTLRIIYEPFFTPPLFYDIKSDWAIMNWNFLNNAFEGDKNSEQLKNVLDGQFSPVVKNYPSRIEDALKTFGLGLYFSSKYEKLQFALLGYTGYSIFPMPFFDSLFLQELERMPGTPEEKLSNISATEILEPASRGESFLKLEPRRYHITGGGWSYEIANFLLKNDLALYLMADLPDENLKIREFSLLSFALDAEREIIPNLIIIPSVRGIINFSPQNIILIKKGNIFPSISVRYEFYIKNYSFSFTANLSPDVPLEIPLSIRSFFSFISAVWKPTDLIEVSGGAIILGGKDISVFGFFKNNSAIFISSKIFF